MARIWFWVFALLLVVATQASAITKVYYTPPPEEMRDTWVGSYIGTGGQPSSSFIRVGSDGSSYFGFVGFNLSGFPQTATKALIQLYSIPTVLGPPTAMDLTMLHQSWKEDISWATQPWWGLSLWTVPAPPLLGFYAMDITNVYNLWRSGASPYLNWGLKMAPHAAWYNFNQFYSSDNPNNTSLNPMIYVESNDPINNKITLKWPLETPYSSRVVTQPFREDPWAGSDTSAHIGVCSVDGTAKIHNGTDYHADPGTAVFAAEDGIVKYRQLTSSGNWGGFMVIEHKHPYHGAFTTLYWHIAPVAGIAVGDFVPKGTQIATVANINIYGHASHFHFGVRQYGFDGSGTGLQTSIAGALPRIECDGWHAFPSYFIHLEPTALNPPSTVLTPSIVLFR